MSLRTKVVLAIVALSALATVTIGVAGYAAASRQLHDQVDESLLEASEVLEVAPRPGRGAERARRPGQDRPRGGGAAQVLRERVVEMGARLGPVEVQLVDGSGEVLASSAPLPVDETDLRVASAEDAEPVWRDIEVDGEPYRVLTTSSPGGAAQFARSLAETEEVLASLRNLTLLAVVVVVAVAAGTGWLIAGRLTDRIARLTRAAGEVEATGRLDVDVPVSGNDEAGRLGSAMDRMLAALARSRQEQQRLAQDAGHELRTPLTSLRTNVEVLRRHGDLDAATRDRVLDDLDAETKELAGLVDELVELASGGLGSEEVTELDLGEVAERVAERARRRTGREVVVSGGSAPLVGRVGAVERAVWNLVDNAAKFSPEGSPIEIVVGEGSVEVRDRGSGIDPVDLPRIFDRFHRSASARSKPGSGLGLSMVHDVVAAHGGEVFARGREGGGSCVGFELPVRPGGA